VFGVLYAFAKFDSDAAMVNNKLIMEYHGTLGNQPSLLAQGGSKLKLCKASSESGT
jgi:hypothetical protein